MYPGVGAFVLIRPAQTFYERIKISLATDLTDLDAHLAPLVSKHRLEIDFPTELPQVLADRHRLVQVISDLASNAAKYSEPGTTIGIGADYCGDQVVVTVRDEGPGIPKDLLERVFDPFYRIEGSSGAVSSGIGLGLSICRRLVEAHGGKMWAENEPGTGSTLFFGLTTAE